MIFGDKYKHCLRSNEYPFVYLLFQDPLLGNYAFVAGLNSVVLQGCALCNLDIPPKLEFEGVEYSVTGIADEAFSGLPTSRIHLPGSIEHIGAGAFRRCTNITSIESLGTAYTSIGDYAFAGCVNLGHVNLPGYTCVIGEGTFFECESLESIYLPEESLKVIGRGAFSGCHSLKCVEIPASAILICADAFCNCRNLEEVIIYNVQSRIDIEKHAFDEHTRVIFDPVSKNKAFKI